MIGKIVNVTIDRPVGSCHPKYPDMVYPINYGYVEGVIAPDGEEQDVYILGVDEPVKTFEGEIIAVIHRRDDVEDKWVVATTGEKHCLEYIKEMTDFQEKYFDSYIEM